MPAKIHAHIALDELSYESMKVKRRFSSSALIKFFLKLLVSNERQLEELKRKDEEFREIGEYLAPKLRKLLL